MGTGAIWALITKRAIIIKNKTTGNIQIFLDLNPKINNCLNVSNITILYQETNSIIFFIQIKMIAFIKIYQFILSGLNYF